MNTSPVKSQNLVVNAINHQKSVASASKEVISPSLSALRLNSKVASKVSIRSCEKQSQNIEKKISSTITELKNKNSAQSSLNQTSNSGCNMNQIQLKKIQSLILSQKQRLAAQNCAKTGSELSNKDKFKNIHSLLSLLNSKKTGVQDQLRIPKPTIFKKQLFVNENTENLEPIVSPLKPKVLFPNASASKLVGYKGLSLGNTNCNILQPSLLGNSKFQENLQNIMNSRKIFEKIQKPGNSVARNSKLQSLNGGLPASPTECSVGQIKSLQQTLKKLDGDDLQRQSSVLLKKQISKPQLSNNLNSPKLSLNSTVSQGCKPVCNPSKPSDSLKLQQLNISQLQLLLKDYSSSSVGLKATTPDESPISTQINQAEVKGQIKAQKTLKCVKIAVEENPESKILGKRKRKTERELKILRSELKKNLMWTRESIKTMRNKYEKDFEMSEQQIYKWWWDQTRKRSKKAGGKKEEEQEIVEKEQNTRQDENGMLVSFQDEFGGYSSRLRLQQSDKKTDLIEDQDLANGANLELNLCELLGINVDQIAYNLAVGNLEDETLQGKVETHKYNLQQDLSEDLSPKSILSEHDRNLEENALRLSVLLDYRDSKSESENKPSSQIGQLNTVNINTRHQAKLNVPAASFSTQESHE